jgi:hypothetical protein
MRRCAWVCCSCGGKPWPLQALLTFALGSLRYNNIGNPSARDLGAALQVNRTLTELE